MHESLATLFDLRGRTALVTGAGSGLGQQFALTLAAAGADLVLAARRRDKLEATAAAVAELGDRRTLVVEMDVTDKASIDAGFGAAVAAELTPDIIVNNAGISREAFALQMQEEDYQAVIETNLNGVFWVAQAGGRALRAADRGGSVINIASILGRRVAPMLAAYSAAKAGVIRLTETLALEWARHGIRVNAIAPGFFVTDINREFFETGASDKLVAGIPMRRPGERDELSGALLLLATDAGSYMTGSTVTVDGGHVCRSL